MDLLEGIFTRRSIRKYDPSKPIRVEDMKTVLEAAMFAPSAVNKQPWEFIIVNKPEVLDRITEIHPYAGFLKEAGTAVVMCEDIEKSHDGHGPIDLALASENLMLAAHNLGYGTCFCSIYPYMDRERAFSNLLKLPRQVRPIGLIVIGTPVGPHPAKPDRFDTDKIHVNQW